MTKSKKRKPKPKPQGRPTKCAPPLTKRICALIAIGIAFKTACEAEGIAESTGHSWLLRAEEAPSRIAAAAEAKDPAGPTLESEAPYVAFSGAVTRARALGEISLHKQARAGGKGSHMAGWLLERRFRDNYGKVDRFEHSGPNGKPIESDTSVTIDYSGLSDAELRRLAAGGASTE